MTALRQAAVIGLALVAGLGSACVLRSSAHDWPGGGGDCADDGLDQIRHALRAACAGNQTAGAGMPGAPGAIRKTVLLAAAGTPRIAILSEGQEEWHRWSSCLPAAWAPASVADVELVACIGTQAREKVGECTYGILESTDRLAVILPVTLRDAATGAVAGSATLRHEPGDCPAEKEDQVLASPLEYADVETWLTPLVARP